MFVYKAIIFIFIVLQASIVQANPPESNQSPQSSTNAPLETIIQHNTIAAAAKFQRNNKFLDNPGNSPYEILRRIGRIINKRFPPDVKEVIFPSGINSEANSFSNMLKIIKNPNKDQNEKALELLNNHENDLNSIDKELSNSDNIRFSFIFEGKALAESLREKLAHKSFINLNEPDLAKIQSQLIPLLENTGFTAALLDLSNRGLKFCLKQQLTEQNDEKSENEGITISDYLDPNSIFTLIQRHDIGDAEESYQNLSLLPQTKTLESFLQSAGLDLKKDILSNMSSESILTVNLEPNPINSLPDIRLSAPIPNLEQLYSILPKFEQLCMQTGILIKRNKDKFNSISLCYVMAKQYKIYVGLSEGFLSLASSYDSLEQELSRISSISKTSLKHPYKKYQKYARINFKDFNRQLQMLLASPLFSGKGIPPIPNIQFVNDLEKAEFTLHSTDSHNEITVNIPIIKK